MMMGARTGAWSPSGAPLPYDAEVEYLESTGTQFIDTGAIIKYSDVAEVVASINNRNSIFGYVNTQTQQRFNITGGGTTSYAYFGSLNTSFGNTTTLYDTKYKFALGDGKFIVDGTIVGTREYIDDTLDGSLVLFARKLNNNVNDYLVGKLYSFSVTRNGVKILDYIPVRKGNIGYMYDRMSVQFFGNKGTGDFVIGPDKTT